ncbi:unnamed protein product [Camellia sinensis]
MERTQTERDGGGTRRQRIKDGGGTRRDSTARRDCGHDEVISDFSCCYVYSLVDAMQQ